MMKNASLCYIERSGSYLMLLRNKKKNDPNEGKWIGVGGKLEPGESPEECAHREIREETGLTAGSLIPYGKVYFHSDVWESEVMHLFLVTEFEGEVTDCDEGELHWIDRQAVSGLPLWDGDRIFLRYMLSGRRFEEMTLDYSGDRLCRCVVDGAEQELLDVFNEDGSPAGMVASRDYVHWKGLWHSTVHIWIAGKDGQGQPALLLQLRAACKRLYPSHWDISAAGHIPAGEGAAESAVREIEEELGIQVLPEELEYLDTLKMTYDDDIDEGYHDREHCRIYLLRRQVDIPELTLQASEVEKVMWVGLDELIRQVESGSLRHCLETIELDMLRKILY